jgi:hypothetical protein
MKIRPSVSGVVPCGRTDRHDETNSRFLHFCERAQKRSLEATTSCSWQTKLRLGNVAADKKGERTVIQLINNTKSIRNRVLTNNYVH